jgi:GTP cyclohydrolase I
MSDPVAHARAFLEALGLDAEADPELARTPERVAELLGTLFSSVGQDAPDMSVFAIDDDVDNPVAVCALPFKSMCVHHLVPFFGTVDVAYVPGEKMAGFGSFCRIVDWAAAKPQVQERMVEEIANAIERQLEPAGLIVRIRARQMCVEMRGARKRGLFVSTSSRGSLKTGGARDEVLAQFLAAEEPI